MANLSETLHINFYQNQSSIVEVMIKKNFGVFFMPHSVEAPGLPTVPAVSQLLRVLVLVLNYPVNQ